MADFIMGYSLSVLKIDHYSLSFLEWWIAYLAYWNCEHIKQRGDWERARMVSFYSASPHVKSIRKPTDIVKFDWEKKKHEPMSKEEFYKLKEKYLDGQ